MRVTSGICSVLFACDVGQRIDLHACRPLISDATEAATLVHRHRVPTWFQFDTPPLRVIQQATPPSVGGRATSGTVETVLYEFGAASVSYGIPFSGTLEELAALSCALAADTGLQADALARLRRLLDLIRPAVTHPRLDELLEDYFILQVREFSDGPPLAELPARHAQELARILRSETQALSEQEVAEATALREAFGPNDLTLVDWNAALVFDRDAEDVHAVLEFANVQLLELRFLDRQLDTALDRAYEDLVRPRRTFTWLAGAGEELHRVGRMQVDGAVLHERVTNALKLLGDQFLARVHALAARRLHLTEWNESVAQKLATLESVYGKLNDRAASRRMEVMEWIVIALIAAEIVLPLLGVRH